MKNIFNFVQCELLQAIDTLNKKIAFLKLCMCKILEYNIPFVLVLDFGTIVCETWYRKKRYQYFHHFKKYIWVYKIFEKGFEKKYNTIPFLIETIKKDIKLLFHVGKFAMAKDLKVLSATCSWKVEKCSHLNCHHDMIFELNLQGGFVKFWRCRHIF